MPGACSYTPRMLSRASVAAALLVLAIGGPACRPVPPPPIDVHPDRLVVHNRTQEPWRDVRVLVNHHFGGGIDVLQPGGRMDVPLARLQTGLGQKFDRGRQAITRIEVTATTASGAPVRLLWPEDADAPVKPRGSDPP
jgi:hypothetical protein